MMPVPCAALVWTLVDVFICGWSTLHPIYAVVQAVLLVSGYIAVGITTALMYSWHIVACIPSFFFFLDACL